MRYDNTFHVVPRKLLQIYCLCLLSVFLLGCNSSSRPHGINIEVRGSKKFKAQVSKSLRLLKNKAPAAYEIVTEYVGRIEQGEHSGMWAYKTPPTFELNDRSAFYSVTWCASVIAHDSYHSKLYHDYRRNHSGAVPYEVWGGFDVERICLKHQVEVLEQIDAPEHELAHCRKQDGTHPDINRDGKIDWDDHRMADW